MTRLLINEEIAKKAEEDLERLLMSSDLNAELFNYSPFILRIINDILLEKGYSLGLGEKTPKNILDKYWLNITLPQNTDILVRTIDGFDVNFSWSIVVLIRNHKIKELVWEDFNEVKKLRPKSDRILRGSLSKFDKISPDELVEHIIQIIEKHSLTYSFEKYDLKKSFEEMGDNVFEYLVPSNMDFQCNNCNLCELPSNYSINPLPNQNDKPFQEMFSEKRIGFSSNLACLSLAESIDISTVTNLRIEKFCNPIIYSKNKEGVIVDYQLALRQDEGLCKFHNMENGLCEIHEHKPLNCFSYPFLTQKKDSNHFIIEVDYSCPGLKEADTENLENIFEEIQVRLVREELDAISFAEVYSLKWDLSKYYKDGERVYQEDVNEALNLLTEKYAQYKK
jgi:Fe-S-cluster containining protein